jgi:hypothetical protein
MQGSDEMLDSHASTGDVCLNGTVPSSSYGERPFELRVWKISSVMRRFPTAWGILASCERSFNLDRKWCLVAQDLFQLISGGWIQLLDRREARESLSTGSCRSAVSAVNAPATVRLAPRRGPEEP